MAEETPCGTIILNGRTYMVYWDREMNGLVKVTRIDGTLIESLTKSTYGEAKADSCEDAKVVAKKMLELAGY